jgi:heptosyltransferase II
VKLLIFALSGIGDALMFTPALKLIAREFPDTEIDTVVMLKGVKDMYERNPAISKVIYFDFLKEGFFPSVNFLLKLRKKYDASVNVYPSNRKEYNIINYLVGAEKRAGVNYLKKDKSNLGFLNNTRVDESFTSHNVQTNIRLIEKLFNKKFNEEPSLEFYLNENDEQFAKGYLSELNIKSSQPVFGFHPGSATLKNHIKRRWEPEKFAQLGKRLIEKHNSKILIFGGPEEAELKRNILNQINSENAVFVETKNLAETAAVMKRCNVFITNDSSLMHVASALKLKVAAIIGPTNQNFIHPWKTEHKIVSLNLECSPCFYYSPKPLKCFRKDVLYKCVKELDVDMVFKTVVELLYN